MLITCIDRKFLCVLYNMGSKAFAIGNASIICDTDIGDIPEVR